MIEIRLYKRNNNGKSIVWTICDGIDNSVIIKYGLVGNALKMEVHKTSRKVKDEIKSRINQKRKEGYKELSELYDNAPSNLFGEDLIKYLNSYLPKFNTDNNGLIKPMLAKLYEYDKYKDRLGQFKINGLRCQLSHKTVGEGFFKQDSLRFGTREGGEYKCPALEQYLMATLPKSLLKLMKDYDYVLDGEIYIPGVTINEINSAAKTVTNPLNKHLQYWVYDLAIENMSQDNRIDLLMQYLLGVKFPSKCIEKDLKTLHASNRNRLVLLPSFHIGDDSTAIYYRNLFINAGFEGLILRDYKAEYQFGKRNQTMLKFKETTDGFFTILDIIPEGDARPDLAKFVCRNDINDSVFEVMPIGNFERKREYLTNKDNYIGKLGKVEYGERSGVDNKPFHAKLILVE